MTPARRPRDRAASERRILDSARARFAEVGFERATVRDIAAAAEVNPALVIQYFGSKDRLFATAIGVRRDLLTIAADGDVAEIAERIARYFFTRWEAGDPADPLVALVRSSLSNAHVAAAFRRLLVDDAITPVAAAIGGDEGARARAAFTGAQMLGVALCRYVIGLDVLAEMPVEDVIAMTARSAARTLADAGP